MLQQLTQQLATDAVPSRGFGHEEVSYHRDPIHWNSAGKRDYLFVDNRAEQSSEIGDERQVVRITILGVTLCRDSCQPSIITG